MARQFASTLFAFLFAFLMIGAAAGPAMAAGSYYQAQLAAPPSAQRLIVRDLVWRCGDTGCTAGKSTSRAATDCAALVREAGAVLSFAVQGRALSAEELEKCNARAR